MPRKYYITANYEKRMPILKRHSVGQVRVSFDYYMQPIPDMLQYILANKTVPSRLINTLSEPLLSGSHMGFLMMSFLPLFSLRFLSDFERTRINIGDLEISSTITTS